MEAHRDVEIVVDPFSGERVGFESIEAQSHEGPIGFLASLEPPNPFPDLQIPLIQPRCLRVMNQKRQKRLQPLPPSELLPVDVQQSGMPFRKPGGRGGEEAEVDFRAGDPGVSQEGAMPAKIPAPRKALLHTLHLHQELWAVGIGPQKAEDFMQSEHFGGHRKRRLFQGSQKSGFPGRDLATVAISQEREPSQAGGGFLRHGVSAPAECPPEWRDVMRCRGGGSNGAGHRTAESGLVPQSLDGTLDGGAVEPGEILRVASEAVHAVQHDEAVRGGPEVDRRLDRIRSAKDSRLYAQAHLLHRELESRMSMTLQLL